MITNISYNRCECDICGKTEDIPSTLLKPAKWEKVTIYFDYLCCKECAEKLDTYLKTLTNIFKNINEISK